MPRRLLAVLVGLLAALASNVSGAMPASAQNAVGPQPGTGYFIPNSALSGG